MVQALFVPRTNNLNPLDRIKETQRQLDLTNRDMAKELRVSEFWLSKVLNGHRPPSDDLMLRLEDLQRRRKLVLGATADGIQDKLDEPGPDGPLPVDPVDELKERIYQHYSRLIRAAGDDVQRLGWIAEQLRQHVSEPTSWGMKERLLAEAIEARRRQEAGETQESQSKKAQGRAG